MLIDLFPTQIWIQDADPQTQARIADQIAALDLDQILSRPWDDTTRSTFSFGGCNDLKDLGLSELTEWIERNTASYLHCIGWPGEVKITDSWINQSFTGEFMFDHQHPERRISGCYYYRASADSGSLRFATPLAQISQGSWPADLCRDQQAWQVEPKSGRLVMFPAWLTHRVGINHSSESRISIAFNLA